MNESVEEDIGYRSATLKDAILKLDDQELINAINKFSEEKNCRISICHHTNEEKKDEIYFVLDLVDEKKQQHCSTKQT